MGESLILHIELALSLLRTLHASSSFNAYSPSTYSTPGNTQRAIKCLVGFFFDLTTSLFVDPTCSHYYVNHTYADAGEYDFHCRMSNK